MIALLLLAQVVAAVALARLLHRPTVWWTVAPAVAASLGADLTMAFVTADSFRPMAGALALGLVAVLLGQVVRTDRSEVVPAIVSGCGALLVTAPAAALVGLNGLPQGARPVIAIALAALLGALPLPSPTVTGPIRVALGTLVAALVCAHSSVVEPFDGVLVGLPAAVAALVAERALAPRRAAVVIPLLVGITAGAIVGRGTLG